MIGGKSNLPPEVVRNKFRAQGWAFTKSGPVCKTCIRQTKGKKPKDFDPLAAVEAVQQYENHAHMQEQIANFSRNAAEEKIALEQVNMMDERLASWQREVAEWRTRLGNIRHILSKPREDQLVRAH